MSKALFDRIVSKVNEASVTLATRWNNRYSPLYVRLNPVDMELLKMGFPPPWTGHCNSAEEIAETLARAKEALQGMVEVVLQTPTGRAILREDPAQAVGSAVAYYDASDKIGISVSKSVDIDFRVECTRCGKLYMLSPEKDLCPTCAKEAPPPPDPLTVDAAPHYRVHGMKTDSDVLGDMTRKLMQAENGLIEQLLEFYIDYAARLERHGTDETRIVDVAGTKLATVRRIIGDKGVRWEVEHHWDQEGD